MQRFREAHFIKSARQSGIPSPTCVKVGGAKAAGRQPPSTVELLISGIYNPKNDQAL